MRGTFKITNNAELKRIRASYGHWKRRLNGRTYICLLFSMAGGICPVCQRKMILSFDEKTNRRFNNSATVDHVNPLVDTLENKRADLVIMCRKCNSQKGDKKVEILK